MKRLAGLISAAALTVACGQTDTGITTAVKSKLAADDTVKAYQVDVDTQDKVVTLTGEVDSLAAETMALQIARDTDGVRDVIDEIRVVQTAPTTGIDVDDSFGQDVKDAGSTIKDGAEKGADAVADGAKKVGGAVKDAVTDDDK